MCVTITIVTPFSSLSLLRISIISWLDFESRFPVGSSARIIWGSFARALAMATLCYCPPLSIDGRFLSKPFSPTISSSA